MRQKTFSLVVGLVFLLIAVMHVLRLELKWEVVLNGWLVPMWVSWLALVIAGFLGWCAGVGSPALPVRGRSAWVDDFDPSINTHGRGTYKYSSVPDPVSRLSKIVR